MEDNITLETTTGKKIYTYSEIEKIREEKTNNKKSKLLIAQTGPQEDGLHQSVDILLYGGNRGGGKANAYSTPVCTPTGKRPMGELEVGDRICTPYDGVQKVEAIFEQGVRVVYTLHFDDGTTLDCMDNHRFAARETDNVKFETKTAAEIFENYNMGQMWPNSLKEDKAFYELPLCGEVQMQNTSVIDLPIHPFVVGAILSSQGNTHYQRSGYWLGVNKNIAQHISNLGYNVVKRNGSYLLNDISYQEWTAAFPLKKKLMPKEVRKSNDTTHIPLIYKNASVAVRWELLKGFFLYNGGFKHKHPYIRLQNRQLINDIADIARSLGCWVHTAMIKDDPEHMGWFIAQFICPNDKDCFFLCVRKRQARENAIKPSGLTNNGILTKKIMWVEKSRREKCRCITVSGSQHLYLTDAYTVNHNTWVMLAEPFYDISNPNFNGIIFRKNKDDFDNIIKETRSMYKRWGHYNSSADDMTWYFNSGAELQFSIYEMPYQKFDDKYRGQQFAYIGIDELPQMSFKKFKFLMTSNRNKYGIKSRIIGTCNPDPYSWLRIFIDWYLDEDGYVIPERSGKVRYFYSPSDSVEETIWGDTPFDVYNQCKNEIDRRWDPDLAELGYDKTTFFVKSFSFIKADLKYNRVLLTNDRGYLAGLHNQSEAMKARELDGCWNPIELGNDIISIADLEKCFRNDEMLGDNIHRASCDVAFEGGDNCVMYHWIGWHVADILVSKRDSVSTCAAIDAKLKEWGVIEQNFVYDLNGLGQTFKGYFKHAMPFNNTEAVQPQFKNVYDNIKSQCAYMLAERIQQGDMSFNQSILDMRFSGNGFDGRKLRDILLNERKAIKQDTSRADKGWCLIKKEQMKKLVGHSPDFIEALLMREYFEIKRHKLQIPKWVRNL